MENFGYLFPILGRWRKLDQYRKLSFRFVRVMSGRCSISKHNKVSRLVPCGVAGCKVPIEASVTKITRNQNKETLQFKHPKSKQRNSSV